MIVALELELDEDLREFTRYLWAKKITHRVVFNERQQLLVPQEENIELVNQLYQIWREQGLDNVVLTPAQPLSGQNSSSNKRMDWRSVPITIFLLVTSLFVSVLIDFGTEITLLQQLTITPFQLQSGGMISYDSLTESLMTGQIWRFLSPAFMHFSIAHLVFNAMWIWLVGAAIERGQGRLNYVLLLCSSALLSNIAQYYVGGPIFGGLSGIVYAVLGYAWLWDKLNREKLGAVSNHLLFFMLAWLVLGYSGLLEFLELGNIANTAHLAGLIAGLLFALLRSGLKAIK